MRLNDVEPVRAESSRVVYPNAQPPNRVKIALSIGEGLPSGGHAWGGIHAIIPSDSSGDG